MSSPSYLSISIKTWKPDNYGLFDYLAFDFHKTYFKVIKPCTIYRLNSTCYIPQFDIYPQSVPLIAISKIRDFFHLSIESDDPANVMWKVVKNSKSASRCHKISIGEWIKLGKIVLFVKHINTHNTSLRVNISDSFCSKNFIMEEGKNEEGNNVCRICLNETGSDSDPLITPCKCSGTMSQVHVKCLQEWLRNRVSARKSSKTVTFHTKDLICELCKSELPSKVQFRNREYFLADFSCSNLNSYVLLEEFSVDRRKKIAVHLINLEEGENAKIGRSNVSDLRIIDLTVSRTHCKVQLIGSEFYLKDKKSKFGTLVQLENDVKVKESATHVQIGRCVLKISEKTPFDFCFCCRKKNRVDIDKSAGWTRSEGFELGGESAGFLAK